ncbi:MAG: GerMN domain-containing protein [bacterium]
MSKKHRLWLKEQKRLREQQKTNKSEGNNGQNSTNPTIMEQPNNNPTQPATEPTPVASAENNNNNTPSTTETVPTTSTTPVTETPEKTIIANPSEYPAETKTGNIWLNTIKNFKVTIGVIIFIIIFGVWASSGNNDENKVTNDANGIKITVSDKKEEGTVTIVDQKTGVITTQTQFENTPKATSTIEKVKIIAFYGNTKEDPQMINCAKTAGLGREVEKKYESNIVNTVRGLLSPLTETEKNDGYFSSIPTGTYLNYVKINNGIATVSLSDKLNTLAGSCAVSNARAQIESTLKQFPNVTSVVICINDNCQQDTILQP